MKIVGLIVALGILSAGGLVLWGALTIAPSYLIIDATQRREHPIAARLAAFVLLHLRHVDPNEDDLLRQQLGGCSMLNDAHEDATHCYALAAWLIERGARVNELDPGTGLSRLHMELDPDNLRFLLSHGADPNQLAGAPRADRPKGHAGTTPVAFQRALRARVKDPQHVPRFDRAIAILESAGGR